MRRWLLVALLVLGMPASPLASTPTPTPARLPPTMGFVNARIWTGNPDQPWAEAIALRGDRIALVGTRTQIERALGEVRPIDAHGRMITPGFIDSHVHLFDGGYQLSSVQLRDSRTPAEFTRRIAAYARTLPKGAWITGGDWDHQQWGGELPRHEWIDAATPDNPVWVTRLDGHMGLANALAMRAAHVSGATPDESGGTIVRDATGAPTGIFKDRAQNLIGAAIPASTPDMDDRALAAGLRYLAAQGVTSVTHMGDWEGLAILQRAHEAGTLTTRINAAVPLSTWARLRDTIAAHGGGDDWLRIGALKGFADGSLGSHTAAFLAPYSDAPDDRGLLVNTADDLYAWTSAADKAGLQVMVHAIGDRAIRTQLDIFARVEREDGPRDRRFRIEHAQHIAPADIPRFAALHVIASMQPYHAIDDGRWAETAIGHERALTSYAWKSLLDSGGLLAFGSDWNVAPPTPLEGIYAAVTRRTLDGKHPDGWIPSQEIGVEDALRAYTRNGAYAMFAEDSRGTLEPGKLADLVMIDTDITRVAPERIRDARVLLTMVGGKVVYRAPDAEPRVPTGKP